MNFLDVLVEIVKLGIQFNTINITFTAPPGPPGPPGPDGK